MADPVEDLMDEFFPGSKRKRRDPRPVLEKKPPAWDLKPRVFQVNGEDVEFFTIGALAQALEKEIVTLRMWIRTGKMPDARFKLAPRGESTYGTRPAAGIRLWTREQIEAIAIIAAEEGVLGMKPKNFAKTKFTERVIEVMKK